MKLSNPSAELNELVYSLRNLQREAAAIEEEIEAVKDLIKEQLIIRGTDTLLGPDYKVTWKEVTRTSLDTKKVLREAPEVYSKCLRSATYRQFLLK